MKTDVFPGFMEKFSDFRLKIPKANTKKKEKMTKEEKEVLKKKKILI